MPANRSDVSQSRLGLRRQETRVISVLIISARLEGGPDKKQAEGGATELRLDHFLLHLALILPGLHKKGHPSGISACIRTRDTKLRPYICSTRSVSS